MDRLVEWQEDAMEWLIEAWKKADAICSVALDEGDCEHCPCRWGLTPKENCLASTLEAIYEYIAEWQRQRDKEAEEENEE